MEPTKTCLIDPPITSTERLKTGAGTLRTKPNPGRAEFFALPAFFSPFSGDYYYLCVFSALGVILAFVWWLALLQKTISIDEGLLYLISYTC
jgi:hypothetical protein